jgi:hypothetical protein
LFNPGRNRTSEANLANFEQWNFSCGAKTSGDQCGRRSLYLIEKIVNRALKLCHAHASAGDGKARS